VSVPDRVERTRQQMNDPLLSAAGLAIAPIAASGVAAAIAPGRTVGSVIIVLMIAVLAYLGGVVAALRLGEHGQTFRGTELGRKVAANACTPVLLGGVVAAAFSGYAALAIVSASTLWAYRVGLVGARDRLGVTGRDRYPSAAALAVLAGGPAITRAALHLM
jgi:hypothetical protein